ncbi:MAG: hypothetical protein QQN57_07750 [Nitrosopumilus sp.]
MLNRRTFIGYLGVLMPGILLSNGLIHLFEKINQYTGNKNGASRLRNHLSPDIKVIGIGSAGCFALNHLIKSDISSVDFMVIGSDLEELACSMANTKIYIDIDKVYGIESPMYTELARKAIKEKKQEITSILKNSKLVVIIAGLGCFQSSGTTDVLTRLANGYFNISTHNTHFVVTLPFNFEGPKRMVRAQNHLRNLQIYSHSITILPNQDIIKIVGSSKSSVSDVFYLSNQRISMSTRKILNRYCMREDIT